MKKIMNSGLLCLFLAISIAKTNAAPTLELTTDNWETQLRGKTVLVYMSLGCDIGSYASQMFQEAMTDLQGVYVSTFDVNSAYEMMDGKDYGLGTIALIRDGKALESSKESYTDYHYLSGYNNQQTWVYNALKKHSISFSMPQPAPIRMTPDRNEGSINLENGVNAIYRFNDLKDETGQRGDFRISGKATLKNGAFYSDGIYDESYTGGGYNAGDYKTQPFKNGFTVHANVKLDNSDEQRQFILSFGYRAFDFELNKEKLIFSTSLYGKLGEDKYEYADDAYPMADVPFKPEEWNSIIFSTDIESRRMTIIINGKRYQDIRLSERFITFFHKYGMGNSGVQLNNSGWGGVLKGYADDIVVYDRRLNDSELKALYKKHSKSTEFGSFDEGNDKVDIIKDSNKGNSTEMVSSWQGEWFSKWGKDLIHTHLDIQKNGKVTGSYNFKEGEIYGNIREENGIYILEGTWHQSNGSGWLKFELKKGEEKFTGKWGYANDESTGGQWDGLRR